jgi:hypothetical protein
MHTAEDISAEPLATRERPWGIHSQLHVYIRSKYITHLWILAGATEESVAAWRNRSGTTRTNFNVNIPGTFEAGSTARL